MISKTKKFSIILLVAFVNYLLWLPIAPKGHIEDHKLYREEVSVKNFLPLFYSGSNVLCISKCDTETIANISRLMSHTNVYFHKDCTEAHNNLIDLNSDFSNLDAVFIDFELMGKEGLYEYLERFHHKPMKYIVVYKNSLFKSTWTSREMSQVGEIIDAFAEHHVRWQIQSEPFPKQETSQIEHRIFLLRGETHKAWDLIQKYQFPTDCKGQNYFIGEHRITGWGSYISTTHRTLEVTIQYNKTMLLTNMWTMYLDYKQLPERGRQFCSTSIPNCYYYKLTNCTLGDAIDSIHRSYGESSDWKAATTGKNITKDPVVFIPSNHGPDIQRVWKLGTFWNKTRYIDDETYPYLYQWLRLRRYIREIVYDKIEDLDLHSRPYAGIHIRHGDKHKENGGFRHLSYYINETRMLIRNSLCLNVTTCPFNLAKPIPLYIMTDDETELTQGHQYKDFEFVYLSTTRHKGESNQMLTKEQLENKTETFLTLATELTIMERAKVFVSTEGSNLSNIILKMFYRNKPHAFPHLHTTAKGQEEREKPKKQ